MRFIILVFILLSPSILFSQERKTITDSKHKIGFSFGLGRNNGLGFTNINIDRDYDIYLFQSQYHRTIISRKLWGVEALGQPQLNFTSFKSNENSTRSSNSFEFGVNVALLLRLNLFEDYFSLYGLIGSGPHFIAKTPDRQANGFIFSDNFFMGADLRVSDNLLLDIRAGKRHASNLSFKSPNGGINTFIIHFGIVKLL